MEPVAEVEPQHQRRAQRHAQTQTRAAQRAPLRAGGAPGAAQIGEQRALHAGKPSDAERESDRQELGDREAPFAVDEPRTGAGDVAVNGVAAQGPGAADIDRPGAIATGVVAEPAQGDGAAERRAEIASPIAGDHPRVEAAVTDVAREAPREVEPLAVD